MKEVIKYKAGQGRICLLDDAGQELAYLSFELEAKRLIYARHTVVSPECRGQGLAQRLLDTLVLWATERSLLIEPVCSFVEKSIPRHAGLAALLERTSHAPAIIAELEALSAPAVAEGSKRYFKTGRGGYAEHDVFLGVSTPNLQAMLKRGANPLGFRLRNLSKATLSELLASPYHEARLLASYALTSWAERSEDEALDTVYDFYMEHINSFNNWDLVDATAPYIISKYWADKDATRRAEELSRLAASPSMWVQRMAIVSTLGLIRRGMYHDAFRLAEQLIEHKHDLIHKAIGWVLREVGKRIDLQLLCSWLDVHATRLPRTSLRYAIEHLSPERRQHYMSL